MNETMPDAAPLTQQFLASLASFMETEHELLGEGDISSKVKVAIATQASEGTAASNATQHNASATSENSPKENQNPSHPH